MLWLLVPLFTLFLNKGDATLLTISAETGNFSGVYLVLVYDNADTIFILGGVNDTSYSNKFYAYSISSETLTQVTTAPVDGLAAGEAFIVDTVIFYLGGAILNGTRDFVSDIVWKYDTRTPNIPPSIYDHLPHPVVYPCIAPSGSDVFIAGGWPEGPIKLSPLADTQPTTMKYSTTSRKGTSSPATIKMCRLYGTCARLGTSIFFFGGNSFIPAIPTNTIQKFTPQESITTMPYKLTYNLTEFYDNLFFAASVTADDGTIYVVCGQFRNSTLMTSKPNYLSTFDPNTGIFTEVPVSGFNETRFSCNAVFAATSLGDRIYIVGGVNTNTSQMSTSILYINLDDMSLVDTGVSILGKIVSSVFGGVGDILVGLGNGIGGVGGVVGGLVGGPVGGAVGGVVGGLGGTVAGLGGVVGGPVGGAVGGLVGGLGGLFG